MHRQRRAGCRRRRAAQGFHSCPCSRRCPARHRTLALLLLVAAALLLDARSFWTCSTPPCCSADVRVCNRGACFLQKDSCAAAASASATTAAAAAGPSEALATEVLVLSNVFSEADLADATESKDILEDTKDKCAESGEVKSALVVRPGEGGDAAAALVGQVCVARVHLMAFHGSACMCGSCLTAMSC